MTERELNYEWFPARSVRRMLEPVRGYTVPQPTFTYWRRVLGIQPSKEQESEGLYSAQDVVDLAGGIIWKNSGRPLRLYRNLLDQGFRLKQNYIRQLESLTLIEVIELKETRNNAKN